MKLITYLLTGFLIFLISCVPKEPKKENVFYYVSTVHVKNYCSDTLSIQKLRRHDPKDTLIAQEYFDFKGKQHVINMFTNYLYAPVDGSQIYYELDQLGVIYSKSTTWISYSRLKSNNDSINNLIDIALENILLYEKFQCYNLEVLHENTPKKTINF